jgi:hypothetical protein
MAGTNVFGFLTTFEGALAWVSSKTSPFAESTDAPSNINSRLRAFIMSKVEKGSGLESIHTPHVHYQFHWMGDHWKQEIISVGECQSIPKIWSIEGLVSESNHASPTFQHLRFDKEIQELTVARLDGCSGSHQFSGKFSLAERQDEVVMDVELNDRSGEDGLPLTATYLIESSGGHLARSESATMTWLIPEARLIFEADPPGRIESQEGGQGSIRLTAIAGTDTRTSLQTLRFRWKWMIKHSHQIWDREV